MYNIELSKLDDNTLLTSKEVAFYLRMKPKSFINAMWKGMPLPYHKIGKGNFFKVKDIKEYIESTKVRGKK